jgi:hypothetical protein
MKKSENMTSLAQENQFYLSIITQFVVAGE